MPEVATQEITQELLQQLYERYGKTSDAEIERLLEAIVPVIKTHKGEGTPFGFYDLPNDLFLKVKVQKRRISFTFEGKPGKYRGDLEKVKTIKVLVKSSSRFFFKPDIGEVFDQMSDDEKNKTRAVYLDLDSVIEIAGTSGEHFVCDVTLLRLE